MGPRLDQVLTGYREGDNPARWRGHLENLLPARSKVAKVAHQTALPYAEIGDFVEKLRQQKGTAAAALEFLVLTATRTSETIGAIWHEIDLDAATWVIPPERIKAGREHRVPLSAPALAILKRMAEVRHGDVVFHGAKIGRPLSSMAMIMLLRRMKRDDLTAHGFRASFRNWAAEQTNFRREIAEQALVLLSQKGVSQNAAG